MMTTSATATRMLCIAVLASGFFLTVRAPAAGIAPAALAALEPGRWEISEHGAAPRAMCLMDPAALVQVRHGDAACSRVVVESGRASATVSYSCPGAGWGRTALRVDSARAVRIDTQGVARGAPFAFIAQAHRTGDCGGVQRTAALR